MSIIEVLTSFDFLLAATVYAAATFICLPLFVRIHDTLAHSFLQWQWDHIGMPLLRACLMFLFIALAYPTLFGLEDAPALTTLLSSDEQRINYLINLIFIVTLLFPVLPLVGAWEEFILPMQGIAATMLLFSWLADTLQLSNVSYWPGLDTCIYIIIIAFITHWLSVNIALHLGHYLDQRFNVKHSGELLARGIIVFMQSPAILIFSSALGEQL